jgi:hypothetical protein
MPDAGLIEMPPSKQTLADERHRRRVLPPFSADHHPAGMLGPLPDPEQGVHTQLLPRGNVKDFNGNAELLEASGAARKLLRIQNVGGLVHQIARQQHTLGDRIAGRTGFLRRADAGHCNTDFHARRRLVILLAFGLVAIERIAAQPDTEHQVGDRFRFRGLARQIGDDGRLRGSADLAHGRAAKLIQDSGLSSFACPPRQPSENAGRRARAVQGPRPAS